jgi:hypothetical protein
MCWVTAILDICSSPASPMLLLTLSRTRSDSLRGWFKLPRPTKVAPTWPIPDNDLTNTFLPVFFPSTFPLSGRISRSVATAWIGMAAPSGIISESNSMRT